jgi:hypothetical protein
MDNTQGLLATSALEASIVADLSARAFAATSPEIQELLLRSKNEQTFSGLLSHELHKYPTLQLGDPGQPRSGTVLLEFKGKDYTNRSEEGDKKSRNFHDHSIVNNLGEIEVVIENKFWYHFDGSKGKRNPKPEKGIRSQLSDDIYKMRRTLSERTGARRGFILINVVTPSFPQALPKSYLYQHEVLWNRTNGDHALYRKTGLDGILKVMKEFASDFVNPDPEIVKVKSGDGFVDFICAEIKIEKGA